MYVCMYVCIVVVVVVVVSSSYHRYCRPRHYEAPPRPNHVVPCCLVHSWKFKKDQKEVLSLNYKNLHALVHYPQAIIDSGGCPNAAEMESYYRGVKPMYVMTSRRGSLNETAIEVMEKIDLILIAELVGGMCSYATHSAHAP